MLNSGTAVITMKLRDTEFYREIEQIGDGIRQSVQNVGLAAAAAGAAVTASLAAMAMKAADVEIQMNVVNAVFKESADMAAKLSAVVANEVGNAVGDVSGKMQEFAVAAQSMGAANDEAARLGATVAKMGADLESKFGPAAGEGFSKIKSAITGSDDALKQFGITLERSAVSAQAAAMGFSSEVDELTDLQKSLVRMSLIQKQFDEGQISGAAAADAYSVSVGRLWQAMDELTTSIGNAVKPGYDFFKNVLAVGAGALTNVIEKMNQFVQENEGLVQGVGNVAMVVGAAGAALAALASSAIGTVASWAVSSAATKILIAGLKMIPIIGPVVTGIMSAIGAAVSAVGAAILGITAPIALAIAGAVALGAGVYYLHKQFGILNPLLDAMAAVGEYIANVWGTITKKIAEAVQWMLKWMGLSGGPKLKSGVDDAAKSHEEDFKVTDEQRSFADSQKDSLKTPQQKYEEQVAKLDKARQINQAKPGEGLNEEQHSQLKARAASERDTALQQEWEQSAGGQKAKELQQFGDQLRKETMTLEEQVAEKIAAINRAVAADPSLGDVATRAIAEANQKLVDQADRIKKEAVEKVQAERDAQLKQIKDAAELQMNIAKAKGGEAGKEAEIQALKDLTNSLQRSGFGGEAQDAQVETMAKIIARSNEISEQVDQQRSRASFVTKSAAEASMGLGTETMDQRLLEQQKEMVGQQEKAVKVLEKIERTLGGP